MASPYFYAALRAANFEGVYIGVIEILAGASRRELWDREYQLITHFKSEFNIVKENPSNGNPKMIGESRFYY